FSHQPLLRTVLSLFTATATTEIYTLSLHDALPISENVNKWMEEGNKFKPDIFLLEGTSFSFEEEDEIEKEVTQKEMYDKWQNLLKDNKQEIIFINQYIIDIIRVFIIIEISQIRSCIM